MKNYYLLVALFVVSWWQAVAQCEISENFEEYVNEDVPAGWTITKPEGTSAYAHVATSNTGLPSGTRLMRMYSGNATAESGELLFISPMSEMLSDGNHRVTFYLKGTTSVLANLMVGTMDAVDGTFTAVETISEFDGNFNQYKISIPKGTDQYLAFKHDLTDTFDAFDIDDVCIQTIPTCLEVSDVTIDEYDAHSVSFSWSASESAETKWQSAVVKASEGEPISGVVDVEDETTDTVEGLDANTDYYVFVRAYCGEVDGYGAWIGPVKFRTECDIEQGDFCEYFDNDVYSNGDTPFCWTSINEYQYNSSFGIQKNSSAASGGYQFRLAVSSTATEGLNSMLISPPTEVATDGEHRLVFMARSSSTDVGLIVGTMSDPNDAATFKAITTIVPPNGFSVGDFKEYRVTLPDNEDSYFAFKHDAQKSSSYVMLDNVCLETIPSCLEVEDVNVSNVSNSAVDISWVASPSEETAWQYIVVDAGSEMPSAETVGTDVQEATMATVDAGLEANTKYHVYVRANCGEVDGFGAWRGPVEFTTLCAPFEAPFKDGFENGAHNEEIPACWTVVTASGNYLKTYNSSYGISAIEGSLLASINISSSMAANSVALISPEFSDLDATKELAFDLTRRDNGAPEFVLEVGTVASPDDLESFELLDDTSLTQSTIIPEQWETFKVSLENYNEELGHKFIAFRPKRIAAVGFVILMDDFNYKTNKSLSVADAELETLKIFPNPAQNVINVAGVKVNSVSIYTINGQKIDVRLNNNQVNVSHLQSGFYFLEVTTVNGAVARQKFVKK